LDDISASMFKLQYLYGSILNKYMVRNLKLNKFNRIELNDKSNLFLFE